MNEMPMGTSQSHLESFFSRARRESGDGKAPTAKGYKVSHVRFNANLANKEALARHLQMYRAPVHRR